MCWTWNKATSHARSQQGVELPPCLLSLFWSESCHTESPGALKLPLRQEARTQSRGPCSCSCQQPSLKSQHQQSDVWVTDLCEATKWFQPQLPLMPWSPSPRRREAGTRVFTVPCLSSWSTKSMSIMKRLLSVPKFWEIPIMDQIVSSTKIYWLPNLRTDLRMSPYLEIGSLRSTWAKMRLLGWAVIQYDWSPYFKQGGAGNLGTDIHRGRTPCE